MSAPDNRTESLPHEHADVSAKGNPADLLVDEIQTTRNSWTLSKAGKAPIDYAADVRELWNLYDERVGAPPDIGEVKDEQQARRALRLMEAALTALLLSGDDSTSNDPPPPTSEPDRLEWNRATRVLRVGETEVTYAREAHEQFVLLDALQGAGWPTDGIPCPDNLRSKLKDTVDSLRKKINTTRLHVSPTKNGTHVTWRLTPV